jgi:predicted O-linked N-acetylglucosamine transferase (SPINDLY family)
MGVPVISLEGDIWTYRGGGPLYNRLIGHPELVVQDKKSYINLAKELSLNINRLKVYRKEFRGKFLNSPVCDAHGYMKDLENALATAWQEKAKELLLIH